MTVSQKRLVRSVFRSRLTSIVLLVFLLGYAFGLVSLAYEWPPTNWIRAAYKYQYHDAWGEILSDKPTLEFTDAERAFPVEDFIRLKNAADLDELTQKLLIRTWGANEFPLASAEFTLIKNFKDQDFEDQENLGHIDKIIVHQEHGLDAVVYLLMPTLGNGRTFLWHQGTSGFFSTNESRAVIDEALRRGYLTIAVSMPTRGFNPQPLVETDYGVFEFNSPSMFFFLANRGPVLKFFYDPVRTALDVVSSSVDIDCFHVGGVSGGAKIVLGYAAVDRRICTTHLISSPLPMFLNGKLSWNDPRFVELKRVANLL